MRTFLAESKTNGIEFSHQYDALDHDEAQGIADNMGWIFLGLMFSDQEIEAQIELRFIDPVKH